jgi:hypothetical protein
MRSEILILALLVGASNWAFRYWPTRLDLSGRPRDGLLARFLAATGPAAIATLFVASVMPWLHGGVPFPLIAGTIVVVLVFALSRSVVAATLVGSMSYGLAVWGLALAA